jgi:DNA polymerase I
LLGANLETKKTLYLIDGSSYIFRAFFAVRQNLSNSKGMPTNALYGFVNMLQKVVREKKPDYLAVIFDAKEKTFRHEIYTEYKANRSAPPEELVPQFPYFEPLVQSFNIVSLKKPRFEADDIIGTLAKQGELSGFAVTIVSGDKDMMQLISPNVCMLDTMKNKTFGIDGVIEKFGVPPEKVIEAMALIGDSSDNIPGVKGIGPKNAADLIKRFDTLENLYENLDLIDKKKQREKIENDKESAFLSRKLVTIDIDVKLDVTVEDLKFQTPDQKKINEFFRELEFDSLIVDSGEEHETSDEEKEYRAIFDEDSLEQLISGLEEAGEFAVDLETTSKRPMQAEIVGVSFSNKASQAYYIPLTHRYLGVPKQLDKNETLKKLQPILENPKIKKYGHNIKYDLIVFRNEGVNLEGIGFDSMLASYVLNPSKNNHNMDDLAWELLKYKTIQYKDVAGSGVKQIGFDEVEIEQATDYAAEDSNITWVFKQKMEPLLQDETLDLYKNMEIPLIGVLADIEIAGVLLDTNKLKKLSKQLEGDLIKSEEDIYEVAGEKFSINSPKQLSQILFEKLELPVIKKTKTGYSTDVSVLEELAEKHPLPEKILIYRQLAKLKSTYVDTLPQEVNAKTGRVHTSFNQTVAATGRLSSSDPNLQNIPIKSNIGKEIRSAFIVEDGNTMLSADYSQIELRIMAHLSDDPALIAAFIKGEDVHSRTAAEILGRSIEDIGESDRRMAKAVNFGIIYGLSAFGLSRQLKISPKEAKAFIDQYFQLYKNVKIFMEETIQESAKRGYTKTLMNRKRYLPDLNSKNHQARKAAERIAINSPVQGSAADLIKAAMINLHKKMKEKNMRSQMILQVHDELVFESPPHEKTVLEQLVKQEMEGVYDLKAPLIVDTGWGANWNEAH